MSKQHLSRWGKIERILTITQFLIVVLGVYFSITQIKEISYNLQDRQTEVMFKFDERLTTNKNLAIFHTIDNNQLILTTNGGKYSEDELELYLGIFNQLYDAWDRGLMDNRMINENFAYQIKKTSQNTEVRNYLKEIRIEDPEYYIGLDNLASAF